MEESILMAGMSPNISNSHSLMWGLFDRSLSGVDSALFFLWGMLKKAASLRQGYG